MPKNARHPQLIIWWGTWIAIGFGVSDFQTNHGSWAYHSNRNTLQKCIFGYSSITNYIYIYTCINTNLSMLFKNRCSPNQVFMTHKWLVWRGIRRGHETCSGVNSQNVAACQQPRGMSINDIQIPEMISWTWMVASRSSQSNLSISIGVPKMNWDNLHSTG